MRHKTNLPVIELALTCENSCHYRGRQNMSSAILEKSGLMPDVTPDTLSKDTVAWYQQHGFMRVRGIISPQEVEEFREAALAASERSQSLTEGYSARAVFDQHVNVWTHDDAMRR